MSDILAHRPVLGSHQEAFELANASWGESDATSGGRKQKTIFFLGSSLGNFTDAEIIAFLGMIVAQMNQNDRLLLGVDRDHGPHKAAKRILDAYDNQVTADFTLNALAHVNRACGLNFDVSGWEHHVVGRFFVGA